MRDNTANTRNYYNLLIPIRERTR